MIYILHPWFRSRL